MENISNNSLSKAEIARKIRNGSCAICGKAFTAPRAGKLYCSAKCKQFYYSHKKEFCSEEHRLIMATDTVYNFSMKEYERYVSLRKMAQRYRSEAYTIKRAKEKFEMFDSTTFDLYKKKLPTYIKKIELPELSLEQWSFLKVLFPAVNGEYFHKLLASLSRSFFYSLNHSDKGEKKKSTNPVAMQFQIHLQRILEKKVIFA